MNIETGFFLDAIIVKQLLDFFFLVFLFVVSSKIDRLDWKMFSSFLFVKRNKICVRAYFNIECFSMSKEVANKN